MRTDRLLPFALVSALVFVSCSPAPVTDITDLHFSSSSSSSSSSSLAESSSSSSLPATPNVTYVGVVSALEASVYMQGTHLLTFDNGNIVLLQSASVDLNQHVGAKVEVFGSIEPTVESNTMIMNVTQVQVLTPFEASSSSMPSTMCGGIAGIACPMDMTCIDDPKDSCDPMQGGADCSGICVTSSSSSANSSSSSLSSSSITSSTSVTLSSSISSSVVAPPPTPVPASSSSVSSSIAAVPASSSLSSSSVPAVASSSSSSAAVAGYSEEIEAKIVLMAKQSFDAPLWTQKYCTGHVDFCIPVHKNWYFKSFGATTTSLWHVEIGTATIEQLGDGIIILNLVKGPSSLVGASDGEVRTQGRDVVGFKDWDDKHFELVADARLKVPVQYMLSHIVRSVVE